MKTNSPNAETGDSRRALRRLLIVVGVAVILGTIPVLSGLVGALVLYVIARPAYKRLARLLPTRVSAFVITTSCLGLLLVPGAWLISTIVKEAHDALRSGRAADGLAWLAKTRLGELGVAKEIAGLTASLLTWLSSHAVALVGGMASTSLNVMIALFGLYYLLLDADALWRRVTRVIPLSNRVADLLASRFSAVTEALLIGTAFTASLQGTVVGIGFAIVGLQPAVLWGFVTACVSVLPFLGSALVWLPGVGYLLLEHRPAAALFLAVVGAGVASNLDNVVRLFVYRRVSGIHPMLTLVGAVAGVKVLGFVGVLLGPLILSYFFELVRTYEDTLSLAGAIAEHPNAPIGVRRL